MRNSYACSGISFYLQLCSPWDIRERSHCLLWKLYLLSPVPLVTATLSSSPPYQQLLPFPSPIRPVVFGIQPSWLLLPLDLPWGDTTSPRDLSCCCLYHSCLRIIESTVLLSPQLSFPWPPSFLLLSPQPLPSAGLLSAYTVISMAFILCCLFFLPIIEWPLCPFFKRKIKLFKFKDFSSTSWLHFHTGNRLFNTSQLYTENS